MAEAAKQVPEVAEVTAVADTGYSSGEQGQAGEAAGITAVVPCPQVVNTKDKGKTLFTCEAFTYDKASDSWTCPAGEMLRPCEISKERQIMRYGTTACSGCALKPQCTEGKSRRIIRHFYEDAREAMHQRAVAEPSWMALRRNLVEHPFGIMKWLMGRPRFLVRGSRKTSAEMALTVLGFNLKRAITILGVPALLAALQAGSA